MDANDIIKQIKNKEFSPVYLLHGEEPYYIDQITKALDQNVLTEDEKAFNFAQFYGKDSDVHDIISTARKYPMMSEKQLVIVKEAQDLKQFEELAAYLEQPVESTVLVLAYKYKTLDKRKKSYKSVKSNGTIFQSDKLKDYQIQGWIQKHLKAKKQGIDDKACMLLGEFLGTDLQKIANELDKLSLVLPEGKTISSEDIEKNIGISKDYNVFELQNALGKQDVYKAQEIVNYFIQNPKSAHITMVVSSLYTYYMRMFKYHFLPSKNPNDVAKSLGMHPYVVKMMIGQIKLFPPKRLSKIMKTLLEYDLKSKGVNSSTDSGELMKEMVQLLLIQR